MTKKFLKAYYNYQWYDFANQVKDRDGSKCVKCLRSSKQVILQVHHKLYKKGLNPWEYSLSDCITLCKGCHAREHNLIEPTEGWTLISIFDLGELSGICERKGCGSEIRYEHEIYHPDWGYKMVGSSCVEYLTQEDKNLSSDVLKIYTKISNFVHKAIWEEKFTKKGKSFITTKYNHHELRIYGKNKNYAFQTVLKIKGERWYKYNDLIYTKNKNLLQVKELAFIVLKGSTTDNLKQKIILRNIYNNIK